MLKKIFNQKFSPVIIFTISSLVFITAVFLFAPGDFFITSAQTNRTLIKLSNNPTVYWYQNNRSYPVYSDTFTTMQNAGMSGWGSVNTVSSIPNNTGISFIHTDSDSTGLLIKQLNNAAVYRTYDGFKEFISAAAFSRRGYSNSNVIDVTSSIINNFANATNQMQYISQSPADGSSYLPNTPFTVTWNLKNNGTTTWNGYQADWVQGSVNGNTSTNLTTPVRVAADVPNATPGQTVPLAVNMIAPSNPGTYYMYWRMRSLDGDAFGPNFFIRIVVPQPVDGMQYVSQSPADGTAYDSGTPFTMTWRVRNTGNTTWNGYDAFWVQNPSSGNPSTNLTSPLRVSFSVPNIPPGQETDISVTMVAPSAAGTYYSYWQLRGSTGMSFGTQFFIRIVVTAPVDGMVVESQSPPDDTLLRSSETFDGAWQIRNTGNTTWNNYSALWIQTPVGGNTSTNLTSPLRVSMPLSTVTPGNTINLTIPMITPSEPGTYYMYWQLQNGSGVAFGSVFRIKVNVIQTGEASFGLDREDFGNADSPGSNVGVNDDSLNTATGNFNYQIDDLTVTSRGMNFIFSRSYNAQDGTGGPLGVGWSHSYNIYLLFTPNNSEVVTVHYSDGKRLTFGTIPGGDVYIPRTKGYHDSIIKNSDNTWSLIKPDQREFRFNHLGFLLYIQDQNNNRVSLTYNGSDSIGKITDTVGREFTFTYTNFLLTRITDPIGRTLRFQYTNGKLTKFTDPRDNSTEYTYDANGRLSEVWNGRGFKIMTNSYDSQGRLISQKNGRNFLWEFSYDTVARKTYVTDPNSKQITYLHDAQNKLLSFNNRLTSQNRTTIGYNSNDKRGIVTDPNNQTYGYEYDNKGNIEKSTDPLLKTRSFVYDSRNNPTEIKDELQNPTSYGYDNRGNLQTISNALSHATSITYNSYGQPETITDPELNMTVLTYDPQGNLKTVTDAENESTTFNYDGVSRRTSIVNARGNTTTFSYDSNDNLTSVQREIGGALYSYDEENNLTVITDSDLNLTKFEYDANNNLVKEIDPTDIYYVQHTYDSLDRRIETRDRRGNTTNFDYDAEGRLLSVTDPLLNKTKYTYDANGNRLTVTDANNQATTFTYDELNRVKTIRDPLDNEIKRDYDPAGRLMKETDGRLSVTTFTYDTVNNLTQINDAESGITKYLYDKNHNLKKQFDPVRAGETDKISEFTYDKVNRLVSSKDPLNNTYIYTYDEVGNRLTQRDAKQQLIQFSYDNNERLASIIYPDNSVIRYFYDANNNLIRMEEPLGTSTYSYDSQGRLISYKDLYNKTIGYQYDPNGNITVLTYPDGKQVQYEYDENNRMISVTDWTSRKVRYEFTKLNQIKKITPPISSANGETTFTYDIAGRLKTMVNAHIANPDNTYSFVLDANGNRTSASIQEPLNNRVAVLSQAYSYDGANRIQNAGSATFAFDNNSNMTSKTQNGVTTNYIYDFNDRLINDSVNTYFYNGQGVRVSKSAQGNVTRYVVDINRELSQVLCETDSNGNINGYYVYGQGLIYKVLPDGTHYYYQFDSNGSTISMTTEADAYVNRYTYDSFGKITNSVENDPNTSTTVSNPFKYGGRFGLMDEGNGLVYVRARFYSPELGRFLTKDPLQGDLRNGQSLNRYIYALGNPKRFVDPDGLQAIEGLYTLTDEFRKEAIKTLSINGGVESYLYWRKNSMATFINNNGFSSKGESAFKAYTRLNSPNAAVVGSAIIGTAISIAERTNKDFNNPNLSGYEKAARVSLTVSDGALIALAGKYGGAKGEIAAGTFSNASFEKRYSFFKSTVDGWFAKTEVNYDQYNENEKIIANIRQQQRSQPKMIQPNTIQPRGPAKTLITPRGPAPFVSSPRTPNSLIRSYLGL